MDSGQVCRLGGDAGKMGLAAFVHGFVARAQDFYLWRDSGRNFHIFGAAPYVFKACSLREISAAEPDLDADHHHDYRTIPYGI